MDLHGRVHYDRQPASDDTLPQNQRFLAHCLASYCLLVRSYAACPCYTYRFTSFSDQYDDSIILIRQLITPKSLLLFSFLSPPCPRASKLHPDLYHFIPLVSNLGSLSSLLCTDGGNCYFSMEFLSMQIHLAALLISFNKPALHPLEGVFFFLYNFIRPTKAWVFFPIKLFMISIGLSFLSLSFWGCLFFFLFVYICQTPQSEMHISR